MSATTIRSRAQVMAWVPDTSDYRVAALVRNHADGQHDHLQLAVVGGKLCPVCDHEARQERPLCTTCGRRVAGQDAAAHKSRHGHRPTRAAVVKAMSA